MEILLILVCFFVAFVVSLVALDVFACERDIAEAQKDFDVQEEEDKEESTEDRAAQNKEDGDNNDGYLLFDFQLEPVTIYGFYGLQGSERAYKMINIHCKFSRVHRFSGGLPIFTGGYTDDFSHVRCISVGTNEEFLFTRTRCGKFLREVKK